MKHLFEKLKIYGIRKFIYFAVIEIRRKIINELLQNSFSQKGEDIIIDKLLNYKKRGLYIDVGAYDPHRISNTKRFYQKGWKGLNIEPDPDNFRKFTKERKRDVNINVGIGKSKSYSTFYKFIPDTLSTFSKSEAYTYKMQGYKLIKEIKVKIFPLSFVLNKYLRNNSIDFLSIDTEGYDKVVLESNDWYKYKPTIICIESSSHNRKNTKKARSIENYLKKFSYNKVFDNSLNSIYLLHAKKS